MLNYPLLRVGLILHIRAKVSTSNRSGYFLSSIPPNAVTGPENGGLHGLLHAHAHESSFP